MTKNNDDRYDRVFTDPKFWTVPRSQKRLKIDKRFERMFSDEQFCAKSAPVDRRGRPSELVRWADKSIGVGKYKNDLEKFYEVSEDVGEDVKETDKVDDNVVDDEFVESTEVREPETKKKTRRKGKPEKRKVGTKKQKKNKRKQIAGDGSVEATSRIAICNQDWDRIRAIDLFMLARSFLPSETPDPTVAAVKRVTIHQSAYGAERQAIDDLKGPSELRKAAKKGGEEDEKAMREGLIKYQRNRLRYCYAILECDSANTALALYRQLDGLEYEDSCTRLDLKFVPDGMSFDDCKVMSVADDQQAQNSGLTYEPPPGFITTALGQTAVKLTWEEEQTPERKRALQALLEADSDQDEDDNRVGDVDHLVAPPSDAEEHSDEDANSIASSDAVGGVSNSDDEDRYQRYRSLLLEAASAEDKAPVEEAAHMEVTWDPGLSGCTGTKVVEKEDDDSGRESDSKVDAVESKKSKKEKKRKADNVKSEGGHADDVQAIRMMFGNGDDDDKMDRQADVDGASDPRFAAMLTRPEFHRDVDHSKPKKRKKTNKVDKKNKRREHSNFH